MSLSSAQSPAQSPANKVLQYTFGYPKFRGQQQAIIDSVIAGHNALVIMPTGGGKSLCYQIPAIVREGCGIVISPLIALMEDQVNALKELGIRANFLNSTQTAAESYRIESELLAGELDVLYIAPERLNQQRTFQLLQQSTLSVFAIDEAHCVSQWGHDFRADYLRLDQLTHAFPHVPRIALTATADQRTREEINRRLSIDEANTFLAGFDRPNIFYQIEVKQQAKQQLLRFIKAHHSNDAGIVYCLSRKKTETIAAWLSEQGFTALPYHAGLSHEVRSRHQHRFLREEKVIIVATIAFGMGIDKPDVRFVAHLDLPKSIEAYYQETGRAGRDGEPANAWMVYGLEDVIKLREMMGSANGDDHDKNNFKRIEHQKLDAMLGLCEIVTCRRQGLLAYFGDTLAQPCGHCDTCKTPVETWDATQVAQKAMSCVYRTEQRFGVSHLIDVLMGANTEKVQQFSHQQLSVFGIGKELNKVQWRSVYRQLIAHNYLQIDYSRFNCVMLTEQCRPVLRGESQVNLRKDQKVSVALRKERSSTPVTGKDNELWDILRATRKHIAEEKGVPPYVVFHDSVLMQMVEEHPLTPDHFLQLNGVGQKKCDQYSPVFIQAIDDYCCRKKTSGELSETVSETLHLFQQGHDINNIATMRQLSESTVYAHAAQLIRRQYLLLEAVADVSEKDIKKIESAFVDHSAMDDNARLKPIYDSLAEVYDYALLRCVHAQFLSKL